MDHITDYQLWTRRHVPIPDQARFFGVPEWELRAELRDRGWIRGAGGLLESAPCADCGAQFPVTTTTVDRFCGPCLRGESPVPDLTDELLSDIPALLRRERALMRRRMRIMGVHAFDARVRRIGGPESGGRRRGAA